MRETTGTAAARQYAGRMAGFWSGLSGTMRALDTIAGDWNRFDGEAIVPLRTLQYRLHHASELLAGVEPPAGRTGLHDELRDALEDARDATAEVVEALGLGGREAATPLVFGWRGALFRVHLARVRLGVQPRREPDPRPETQHAAVAASLLTIVGAATFVTGTALILWPVWAAGLVLVAAGVLVQRG